MQLYQTVVCVYSMGDVTNSYLLNLKSQHTNIVKQTAHQLGFSFVGIAKARQLDEEARKLEEWLNRGYHGKMSYMENHFDKRIDPTKLVPGAKSVVTLLYNYYNDENQKYIRKYY